MRIVEFFFDVGSPYSYIAATQLQRLKPLAEVRWRPVLVGGIFKATQNNPPISVPARAPYLIKDLQRLCAYYRIPFQMPGVFPANTLQAMRCLHAVEPDILDVTAMALFEAYWVENKNIADPAVLVDLMGQEIVLKTQTEAIKLALKDTTDEAVMRGAFGVPSFFLDEDMFFGEDRIFLLEHVLKNTA